MYRLYMCVLHMQTCIHIPLIRAQRHVPTLIVFRLVLVLLVLLVVVPVPVGSVSRRRRRSRRDGSSRRRR